MADAAPKHRVIQALRNALHSPTPVSAVQLITVGMEELHAVQNMRGAEKLETLKTALRDLATGADGVQNTVDDVIAPDTLTSLLAILDSGMLGDVVDALLGAGRGRYAFCEVLTVAQNIAPASWKQVALRAAVSAFGFALMYLVRR